MQRWRNRWMCAQTFLPSLHVRLGVSCLPLFALLFRVFSCALALYSNSYRQLCHCPSFAKQEKVRRPSFRYGMQGINCLFWAK